MAAKKTAPKKSLNKTAFVRSLPTSTPGAEVVKKAKDAGIDITLGYVYSIRAKSKTKSSGPKRGPGRPPKSPVVSAPALRAPVTLASRGNGRSHGLEEAIEAIVERKVTALLKDRLGALFG
jgi:hypothetical protein